MTISLFVMVSVDEFQKYFEHLQTLSFEDTPDYAYLKSLFKDLFRRRRYAYDHVLYDWEVLAQQRQQQAAQSSAAQTQAQVPPQQVPVRTWGPEPVKGHQGQRTGQAQGQQTHGQVHSLRQPLQVPSFHQSQYQPQGQHAAQGMYRRPR